MPLRILSALDLHRGDPVQYPEPPAELSWVTYKASIGSYKAHDALGDAGDIYVTVFRDNISLPLIDFRIVDCDAARLMEDDRGCYLEFAAGRLFSGRYDGDAPIPYGVRIRVEPSIGLEFFRTAA